MHLHYPAVYLNDNRSTFGKPYIKRQKSVSWINLQLIQETIPANIGLQEAAECGKNI